MPIRQTPGEATSRIEAFSDGVFAFPLTPLVVSLEVPRSYDRLDLTAADRREALPGIRTHPLSVALGLASMVLTTTLPGRLVGIAGFTYAPLGPLYATHAWWSRRQIAEAG